jgi:hypothetical protein
MIERIPGTFYSWIPDMKVLHSFANTVFLLLPGEGQDEGIKSVILALFDLLSPALSREEREYYLET